MKHNKQFWVLVAAVLLVVIASGSVLADLNANEIYTTFNSTNDGRGFRFTYSVMPNGIVHLETQPGFSHVNFDAYLEGSTGGQNYFTTFCVEPEIPVIKPGGWGRLNYDPVTGISQTANLELVLSLGAAFLYKQYATGDLVLSSESDVFAFNSAIHYLMAGTASAHWASNTYLSDLLDWTPAIDYWTADYKPAQYYAEIGYYSVFVMEVTDASNTQPHQNFLYLGEATTPPAVPEPATVLIWSLGGMSLVGSWMRQRRLKKLAIS
ncbi:MAG: hypothetical protein FWD31_05240 [Planctomycetaceae bacterium]|nr:hypothetical protein [Planctomycetaceae bacterium]